MSRINRLNRLSRISSLRTSRVHSDFVHRMAQSQYVEKVERIDPVQQTKTPTHHPSENYLLSYEQYYEKLKDLKKEFKNFYHHEQALYKAIQALDKDEALIISQTDKLIQKYNQALVAVQNFDRVAGTSHTSSVRAVFQSFSEPFAEIGVHEDANGYLTFTPDIFVTYLKSTEDSAQKLIGTFKQMILKEYQSFLAIHLPKQQRNPYEQEPFSIKGLLIEEQT